MWDLMSGRAGVSVWVVGDGVDDDGVLHDSGGLLFVAEAYRIISVFVLGSIFPYVQIL